MTFVEMLRKNAEEGCSNYAEAYELFEDIKKRCIHASIHGYIRVCYRLGEHGENYQVVDILKNLFKQEGLNYSLYYEPTLYDIIAGSDDECKNDNIVEINWDDEYEYN